MPPAVESACKSLYYLDERVQSHEIKTFAHAVSLAVRLVTLATAMRGLIATGEG